MFGFERRKKMKSKKIIKTASSFAIVSCALLTALVAKAEAATMSIKYDEANSTSQVACVSVCLEDATAVESYCMVLKADNAKVASYEVVDYVEGMNHNFIGEGADYVINDDGTVFLFADISGQAPALPESGAIFTLKLTFEEPLSADTTITWVYNEFDGDYSYVVLPGDVWITSDDISPTATILANPNAGGGKVEVNATGALYDTYDDAPVYACAADEAVTVADITGKTLTWQVKDTEGVVGATIPVTVRTDVNGDGSVIFGLKIIGDENAEKLEKIDSAVLVIE